MPHSPQSEAVMLRRTAPPAEQTWEEAGAGVFPAAYHGLGRIAALVQAHEQTEWPDGRGQWDGYHAQLPGVFVTGYDMQRQFAVGVSFRTALGLDATMRVAPRQYITVASTLYRLTGLRQIGQAYYHVHVAETAHSGFTVGAGYREDLFTYSFPIGDLKTLTRIRNHVIGSAGGRVQMVLHSGGRLRLGIRLSGYLGRALSLKQTVWSFTLSAGRF
ncbi:MAG: hypothetical protein RhofKO_38390 [Rhodothermales bacterium]